MKKSIKNGGKELSKSKMKKVKGGGHWINIDGEWIYIAD